MASSLDKAWKEFGGPKLNTKWRDLQPLSLDAPAFLLAAFSVVLVPVAVGPSLLAPLIKIFATYEVPARC